MSAEHPAASVYRCPECGSEQPEPGTCGRCPGTVREADSAARDRDWTPPFQGAPVRGAREIAGPTRDTRTWEAKALECLYALGALPPDDLAREDYRCAAQVYALLEVAESLRGQSHERKEVA